VTHPRGMAAAVASGVLATFLVAVLTGCEQTVERVPTVLATPNVLWETPEEAISTSPLEEDDRVKAVRGAELGLALATNARDFSIAQITDYYPARTVDFYYRRYDNTRLIQYVGPPIMLPLAITELDGGGAEVTFCVVDHWQIDAKKSEATYDFLNGETRRYTVEKDPETGNFVETDWQGMSQDCDATGAPVGRFDPAVEQLDADELEPIVPRVGYEE
jgi:hypothetical protein